MSDVTDPRLPEGVHLAIRPEPTDEELAAIVAAIAQTWRTPDDAPAARPDPRVKWRRAAREELLRSE